MDIEEKLRVLPPKPGVYLMKDSWGKVIYVGKAISLRDRVRSYFRSVGSHPEKVKALVSHIENFDYIVTASEMEALVLECNLIKEYKPQFNVKLISGTGYPFIKITLGESYPQIRITRTVEKDGSRYFGPYADSKAVRRVVKLAQELFPLCNCSGEMGTKNKGRGCLNYHIKRCLAPCIDRVTEEEYRKVALDACLFIEGRNSELIRSLRERMVTLSENLEFEKAADLRDKISSIEKITQKQRVFLSDLIDRDVIALARSFDELCVGVFFIREGKLVGRENFLLNGDDVDSNVLEAFIKQYYANAPFIPGEILLNKGIERGEKVLIEKWLSGEKGRRVYIKTPERGDKKRLVEMASADASVHLERVSTAQKDERSRRALLSLKDSLELSKIPECIEAFDISNIQGRSSVASMVSFERGKPNKKGYKRFKIREHGGSPNDFAMMNEVVRRRYKRLLDEGKELPDLILIDGGKGQLSSSLEALKSLDLNGMDIISLAKKFEHIFKPGREDPIVLPRNSPALRLLQQIRDESHRFAVAYHRKLRRKGISRSVLDEIPGIGSKRKSYLIKHFGSLKRLKLAEIDDIAKVETFNRAMAEKVYSFFHK